MQAKNEKEEEDDVDALPQHKPLQGLFRQVAFSFIVGLGMFLMGFSFAYTAPAIVSMADPKSTLVSTIEHEPLVGSLLALGALVGCFLSGPMMDIFGRRVTTYAIGVPYIGAWLMIYFSVHWAMVHFARLVSGILVGISSVCTSVYMAEALQPELRGVLGLIPPTVGNVGIVLCYLVGKYIDWRNLALLGAIISVPYTILSFILPESPHWYVTKGKQDKAKKALRWLRGGKTEDVYDELATFFMAKTEMKKVLIKEKKGFRHICTRRYRKPFAIAIILQASSQLVGIAALISYSVGIFEEAGSHLDKYWSATIVAAVKLLSTIGSNITVDFFGRRVLLLVSSAGVCASMGAMSFFLFVKTTHLDLKEWEWVPLTCMTLYVITFSCGLGSVPWLMQSEIVPAEIRGLAASVASGISWMCAFFVLGLFPIVRRNLGNQWSFMAFALMALLTFLFVLFEVPETRERSLEDIERALAGLPRLARPPPRDRRLSRRRSTFPEAIMRWSVSTAIPVKTTPLGNV